MVAGLMPTSPLAPGTKLDRYELVCPIGEGGMATVWIARQAGKFGFQKLVAVKTILPRFAADPRFQRMFIDEARIASRIDHLNVVQILDVGEQDDISYLVMEHVEGESLQRMQRAVRKKGMHIPPGVLLRVMADVCAGLHAAHELCDEQGQPRGVIHRDVSPQNVLVSTKGVAKLIDFGIAKARDRLSGDTTTDQVKGKLRYMAPEQAVGQSMDRRADVWSVGAVLYHLLAGRPPFDGEHDVAVLAALTSGRSPEPLPADIHPSIAAAVMRALTPAPDGRFDTAASMQQALEDAMVAAQVGTSTGDVATFLAQVSAEDADKRREAVRRGLEAANAWDGASDDRPRASVDPPSFGGRTLGSAALTIVPADRRRTLGTAIVIASAGVLVGVVGLFVASTKSHVATASATVAASAAPPSVSAPAASAPTPADTQAPPPSATPAAAPPPITRPTGSVHRPPRPLPATAPAHPPSPGGKTGDGRVNDGF